MPAAQGAGQAWRLKPCAHETAGVALRVSGAGRTPQQSSLATAANGGETAMECSLLAVPLTGADGYVFAQSHTVWQ